MPNAKSTLALLILLWKALVKPAELAYSQQKNEGIILDNKVEESLIATLNPLTQLWVYQMKHLFQK